MLVKLTNWGGWGEEWGGKGQRPVRVNDCVGGKMLAKVIVVS